MTGTISQLSDVIIISVATLFVYYCMYVIEQVYRLLSLNPES